MKMGAWLANLLALIPIVVSGIEHIHGDVKTGVDKKKLALEALGLSVGVAGAMDPDQKAVMDATYDLASSVIDKTKTIYNIAMKKADPQPGPALVASPLGNVTPVSSST